MHPAIRRYVWILQVALVAAVALAGARTVNLILEALIAPAPGHAAHASSSSPPERTSTPTLDLAALSRITGLPVETAQKTEDGEGPSRTDLRVRLLGTLLSTDPAWSIASLLDLTRQKTSTVMVGDQVQDSRVVEILRDRVIVARNGRREVIGLAPGDGAIGPSPDSRMNTAVQGSGIRSIDENRYEVPRSELEAALNQLDKLATDVRILPAYKDGHPEGFKLFAIRPGSLFSLLGMVSGDVVRRINGFEMNTPANALEAYTRLRDANRIDVDLERNGSSIRKSYSVR